MRCWSARATARCWSPRRVSATRCASATRPGRRFSPSTSSSPRCCSSASSRWTSACALTARSRSAPNLDAVRSDLAAALADGIKAVAIVFMHAYRYADHEKAVAALAREMGFAQVSVSHEVSPLIKLVGRGDTTVVDAYLSPILRRYVAQVDISARCAKLRRASDVHDVLRRPHRGRAVPGQGRDPLRPCRRRRRHGADRARGRLLAPHRLRHGRHLDRRLALRRRIRARLRDRSRGRAHARPDDADPYGGGRRRLDPPFRRRPLPRRPGLGGRQSGAEVLPPRRAARRHRRQCDGRQAHPGFLPEDLRSRPGPAARCRRRDGRIRGACEGGRRQVAGGNRRRLHQDRGRKHGERHQEDFRAARLRRDRATRSTASAARAASTPASSPTRSA